MHGETACVAQEICERHLFLCGEFVVRQLPGLQFVVDIFVEQDLSVLHSFQRHHCCHRFADRSGLEKRFGGYRFFGVDVFNAITASPFNFEVFYDGDTEARHLPMFHSLFNGP